MSQLESHPLHLPALQGYEQRQQLTENSTLGKHWI